MSIGVLAAVVTERGIACFKHRVPELSVPRGIQIVFRADCVRLLIKEGSKFLTIRQDGSFLLGEQVGLLVRSPRLGSACVDLSK